MTLKNDLNPKRMFLVREAAKLFRDKGYEKSTVRDLAHAVGLQSGSLFYHFRNKEEILAAVMALGITSTTDKLNAALELAHTPLDRLDCLFRVHLHSLLGENQAALEVMLYEWRSLSPDQKPPLIILRDSYEAIWQQVLDEASQAGLVHTNTKLLRRTLLGSLHWSVQWYSPTGAYSVDELSKAMMDLVLRPPR